jgi:hypothetical protein
MVAHQPAAELPPESGEQESVMAGRVVGQLAVVGMVVGALLGGTWVHAAGAKAEPKYSRNDCETISNIEVKGSENGYYGKTALNASKAYADAAQDIEDGELKAGMTTLSKTWAKAGKLNAIAASKVLVKAGKKYNGALEVFLKALTTCSTESFDADDDSTSTTEPDDS